MTCKVETCWNGHFYTQRVLYPTYGGAYQQITLRGEEWNRKLAKEAKDIIIDVYHAVEPYKRDSIRFQVR